MIVEQKSKPIKKSLFSSRPNVVIPPITSSSTATNSVSNISNMQKIGIYSNSTTNIQTNTNFTNDKENRETEPIPEQERVVIEQKIDCKMFTSNETFIQSNSTKEAISDIKLSEAHLQTHPPNPTNICYCDLNEENKNEEIKIERKKIYSIDEMDNEEKQQDNSFNDKTQEFKSEKIPNSDANKAIILSTTSICTKKTEGISKINISNNTNSSSLSKESQNYHTCNTSSTFNDKESISTRFTLEKGDRYGKMVNIRTNSPCSLISDSNQLPSSVSIIPNTEQETIKIAQDDNQNYQSLTYEERLNGIKFLEKKNSGTRMCNYCLILKVTILYSI